MTHNHLFNHTHQILSTRAMQITSVCPHALKIPKPSRPTILLHSPHQATPPFPSHSLRFQSPLKKKTGFLFLRGKIHGFCVNAEDRVRESSSYSGGGGGGGGGGDGENGGEEYSGRGESTMPDRFRYLAKEAPDPPLRWPWFVALGFLAYTWRAVFFELGNWKRTAVGIVNFIGYLLKLVLAIIFHFIGDPVTFLIRCIEDGFYTVRAFYSGIVAYAPIPELSTIIILTSAILAIAEAAVPSAASSQPYLLTISGIIGYAVLKNYISEPMFWTLLLGLYCFSRLFKKRDDVTSALPAAAVLVAVGEPWVRILTIVSYMALAVSHYSKGLEVKGEADVVTSGNIVPLPLLFAAMAIGIRVGAKWAGYRHLTWMIV